MTIHNMEAFVKNLWDWKIFDGCFGQSNIRPTDVDGLVERNGHLLFFEAKSPGVSISKGQKMMYQILAKNGHHVLVMWGRPGRPEKAQRFTPKQPNGSTIERCDLERVRQYVSAWFSWANKSPIF